MTNPSKAKGTAAEVKGAVWLAGEFPERGCERRALAGALDKGDLYIPGVPAVIEVKNHKRQELAAWVDEVERERANAKAEVGAVLHTRRGKGQPPQWFVTLSGRDFAILLRKAYP